MPECTSAPRSGGGGGEGGSGGGAWERRRHGRMCRGRRRRVGAVQAVILEPLAGRGRGGQSTRGRHGRSGLGAPPLPLLIRGAAGPGVGCEGTASQFTSPLYLCTAQFTVRPFFSHHAFSPHRIHQGPLSLGQKSESSGLRGPLPPASPPAIFNPLRPPQWIAPTVDLLHVPFRSRDADAGHGMRWL